MQLAIYIECDDNVSKADLRKMLLQVAQEAAITVAVNGAPAVDREQHINVAEMPQVWSAQLCRHH